MLKNIENKDFENYRQILYNNALGLLKQKGSANVLYGEYDEKAKDIVQECYLVFHSCKKNIFATNEHLRNYLNVILYKKYQESVDKRSRSVQYNMFKRSDLETFLDSDGEETIKIPSSIVYNQEFYDDYNHKFLESLNDNQKEILFKLMNGIKASEIYKEKNISRQAFSSSMEYIRKRFKEYENKNS